MMAVCYRLFLTGANAEILDKKTAEPPKSCFSGHQRVRPWRLSKAVTSHASEMFPPV